MKIKTITTEKPRLYKVMAAIGVIAAITNAVVVEQKVVVRTVTNETIEFRMVAANCWQAKRISGSLGIASDEAIEVLNSFIQ